MTQDFPSMPIRQQLTPEEIEHRPFPPVRKGGLEEESVRSFLRDVARYVEQLEAQSEARELALEAQITQLQHDLETPPVPTGQRLVELVGEEVARTLRTAQESADEMRVKAEERAARTIREAQEDAQRLREEQLGSATQNARAMVESARERGREMVGEARALRERVLADLNRRREALQAQSDELRAGREQLAATYRTFKQTLAEASTAFDRFEAGRPFEGVSIDIPPPPLLPPERPQLHDEPRVDVSRASAVEIGELTPTAEPAAEQAEPEVVDTNAPVEVVEDEVEVVEVTAPTEPPSAPAPEPVPEPEPEPVPEPEPAPAPQPAPAPAAETPAAASEGAKADPTARPFGDALRELRSEAPPDELSTEDARSDRGVPDLDEIFRRIRAGRSEEPAPAPSPEPGASATADPAPAPAEPIESSGPPTQTVTIESEPPPDASADARALTARDELLARVSVDVTRTSKRMLQDEQNELLDRLRRQRRGISAEALYPPLVDQVSGWADAIAPSLDEVYVGARLASTGERPALPAAPRRLVAAMAEVLVTPLRERVLSAVTEAAGSEGDADAVASRIGARYREWKSQELDGRIGDLLAATYARSIYDAAPEGARLRWIPAQQGKCSDCDDNALEPTVRGNRFPTGQPFPPAHPGCRCLLEVVDSRA